jgi:hypothetical protein
VPLPTTRRALLSWVFALLLPACASTASYHDGWVEKDGHRIRVGALPAGWERVSVGEEDLAFRDTSSNAVITTQMTCGKKYDDAPLKSLTRHLWFGLTSVEVTAQNVRPLGGREALDTTADAKLDGVPVRLRTIVMKKDGCVIDFTLSQPRPDGGWEAASAALEGWADGE